MRIPVEIGRRRKRLQYLISRSAVVPPPDVSEAYPIGGEFQKLQVLIGMEKTLDDFGSFRRCNKQRLDMWRGAHDAKRLR
jgi:hypothetical protein